jgi:hypothetical protein
MNQFELAKLKAQKRAARQAKQVEVEQVDVVEAGGCAPPVVVPKEKEPSNAAIIDVTVTLPNGEFSLRLIKQAVLQNASPSRLNRNEFRNRIMDGLRPLLGEVKEG